MDILWSPWRYQYITEDAKPDGCVFCGILSNSAGDEGNFILKRAEFNFVILNAYPYAPGHLMVVPYEHISVLDQAGRATTNELMDLTRSAQTALSETYSPDGINLGMNMGKAAGAGVDGHIHMHVLPRWFGDVNFMTAVGETRTMAETLRTTYDKLKDRI